MMLDIYEIICIEYFQLKSVIDPTFQTHNQMCYRITFLRYDLIIGKIMQLAILYHTFQNYLWNPEIFIVLECPYQFVYCL